MLDTSSNYPLKSISSLLVFPKVFDLFNWIVGGPPVRQLCANQYIRAKAGDRVLDIGCGTADILTYLPSVHYVGFDINPKYIEHAVRRYGERGTFVCQTFTRETVSKGSAFDIALALGVLHHVSDEEAIEVLRLARAALKPGGRLVTLDGCFTDKQSWLERYILAKDRGRHVRYVKDYIRLAREVFSHVEVRTHTGLLLFPYTHIFMECD